MATLQQLIDAQKTFDPVSYTIISPSTGQREIAYAGFAADGYEGDSQATSLYVPESDARQAATAPIPGLRTPFGVNAISPMRNTMGEESGLDTFMEDYAGPLAMSAFLGGAAGGFGIPGASPSGLAGMFSSATGGTSLLDSIPGMTQAPAPIAGGGGSNLMQLAQAGNTMTDVSGGFGDAVRMGATRIPDSVSFTGSFNPAWPGGSLPSWALPAAAAVAAGSILGGSTGPATFSSPNGTAIPGSQYDLNTPLSESALGEPRIAPGTPGDVYTPLGGVPAAAGAGLTLSQLAAGAGVANAGMSLSKLLGLTGDAATAVDALGRAVPGLLGAYAANQQGDALSDIAGKEDARIREFMAYGAPSRDRYEASFAPGFDIGSDPALKGAMDTTSDTLLRRLSATGGNPFGNPSGLIEANKSVLDSVALPYLQNYRNQNASTGGYGAFNTTAAGGGNSNALNLAGVGADTNVWNALGSSASSVFNPPSSLEELLKKFKGSNLFGVQ